MLLKNHFKAALAIWVSNTELIKIFFYLLSLFQTLSMKYELLNWTSKFTQLHWKISGELLASLVGKNMPCFGRNQISPNGSKYVG